MEPSGGAPDKGSALQAEQALMERPELSIRTRITVVFVLLFVLCSTITAAAVAFLTTFRAKIVFLETAASYSFEIEEARRNEKNFFLYGTGLPEAMASAALAGTQLDRNADRMRSVVGSAEYEEMVASLRRYRGLLAELVSADTAGAVDAAARRRAIEVPLRAEGAQLLSDAQDVIARERAAVSSLLHTSMLGALGMLGLMLLIMVLVGSFVIRGVVGPLDRFMAYVERIRAGNYEPIRPVRRYRDEFTALALAFNRMLGEIVTRQEQLVRSARMAAVGTLTSGIAHELNNPLNNIGLTVEALLDDDEAYSPDERREMLGEAYTQVERASTTVRNLLDFTRRDRSAFAEVSVSDVVQSALRLVANEARLAGVTCETSLNGGLPAVRGNPHDLQQVFLNLLLNAIQAMPRGGMLRVSAGAGSDGGLRIDVSDEGSGIAPETLGEIFDPFFTTKEPGEGTGLGLSVSRSIVEKHGGSVSVVSEVGKGTTFTVHLPVAQPHGSGVTGSP